MDYNTLAPQETLDKTAAALKANNFDAVIVETGAEALAKIKELIPAGASVMNGASVSLQQIGFVDYLKGGTHGWNNLHAGVVAETDEQKKGDLRKQAVLSDYYLGSVHALIEDGTLLIASNSGSQLPHLAFTSPNLILVVSTKKIAKDLPEAWGRLQTHVIPLEDARMKEVYGYGTMLTKTLILHKENPALGRKVVVILVKEDLGY